MTADGKRAVSASCARTLKGIIDIVSAGQRIWDCTRSDTKATTNLICWSRLFLEFSLYLTERAAPAFR